MAIKLQIRQLDSFIHTSHKTDSDNKRISRFLSAHLGREQFQILLDEARKSGLLTMCTYFAEETADVILDITRLIRTRLVLS